MWLPPADELHSLFVNDTAFVLWSGRDGKMYERASNARVNLLIVLVKSVTNSTLFCRESELYCNFALKIIVASIVVWRSYFAHSCCQIHLKLFFRKFTFVIIYAPILGKIVLAKSLLV